jgi:hypothetical protein
MSSCTFVIIKGGRAKYVVSHYSDIKDLVKGVSDPDKYQFMSLFVTEGKMGDYTDTGFCPAIIIDFDTKTLTETAYNWFDEFSQYLPEGWKYKEFKPR